MLCGGAVVSASISLRGHLLQAVPCLPLLHEVDSSLWHPPLDHMLSNLHDNQSSGNAADKMVGARCLQYHAVRSGLLCSLCERRPCKLFMLCRKPYALQRVLAVWILM